MELTPKLREHTATIIEDFIASKVNECAASGVVLGLSGGLDSAVVAALCANALGPKKVLGVIMPVGTRQKLDVRDACTVAKALGIRSETVDIAPMVNTFLSAVKKQNKLATGNIAARARMVVLYCRANSGNLLVMGTGNKSEILMGYFTKFGDGGADYLPIGDLYKMQVRELAVELKIPKNIIKKAPSAGLWDGQTDEGEMGIKYPDLDRILHGIELGLSEDEISERSGLPRKTVARVHFTVKRTSHKRRMPMIPKMGVRTLGADWRE